MIGQTDTLGRYAGFFKWLLNNYTGTWPERMTATVAEFDWVLKDGFAAKDDSKGWKAALKADPSILNSWSGFITRNDSLLNRFDIVSNIGRYLGYALQVRS